MLNNETLNKNNNSYEPFPGDAELQAILNDPERRMYALYDARERAEMKIGDDKEYYDPARGRKTKVFQFRNIYGREICNRFIQEVENSKRPGSGLPDGFVSKELYGIMRDRARSKGFELKEVAEKEDDLDYDDVTDEEFDIFDIEESPVIDKVQAEPEPVVELQREWQAGDDYFFMLERGLFRNPEFRKMFKGNLTVYGWLWSNIARKGWNDKPGYPIKAEYYERGLLVYCASFSQVAKDCFLDKDTVRAYISDFQKKGIIRLEHITPVGKKRGQSVFILGKWKYVDGKPQETYFLKQVFLSGKSGASW